MHILPGWMQHHRRARDVSPIPAAAAEVQRQANELREMVDEIRRSQNLKPNKGQTS